MTDEVFYHDPHPYSPKILFVGIPYSAHNLSWIGMLSPKAFNVRFFGVTNGYPPDDWPYKTYIPASDLPFGLDPANRQTLYPTPEMWQAYNARLAALSDEEKPRFPVPARRAENMISWLAQVIMEWEPDIIHTLGLDPASFVYLQARDQYHLSHIGSWIVQSRGRLDLLNHDLVPTTAEQIERILSECDQFIADNPISYQLAQQFGLAADKVSPLHLIPGSGGVEVSHVRGLWQSLPSKRGRVILWPKATDNIATRALPIFEALKECWDQIQPCELLIFPGFKGDLEFWFNTLPAEIRQHCHISASVSREKILELMTQARVMLAPSLTDGIPNVLYESMAAGAFPIVSPLETMLPVFEAEKNVLYARNLYPTEIAAAITRAMTDDNLVDQAAERNFVLVSKLADRTSNTQRVSQCYQELSSKQRVLSLQQMESRLYKLKEDLEKQQVELEKQRVELLRNEALYLNKISELEQMEAAHLHELENLRKTQQNQQALLETMIPAPKSKLLRRIFNALRRFPLP